MRRLYLAGILLAIVGLLAVSACTFVPPGASPYGQPYPYGQGGMMGPGMMGGGGGYNPQAPQITIDQAFDSAKRYVGVYYGDRLAVAEVMEFAWNFYAEVEEKDTGIHAIEILIDKNTGQVYPEMGPNMMWNSKYSPMSGMMDNYGGAPTAAMPVTSEQARELAQQFLNANAPGLTMAEADTFYGYYTLHTLANGRIEGMLSVNGYTGAVWYHSWHGPFIGMSAFPCVRLGDGLKGAGGKEALKDPDSNQRMEDI